MAKTLYENSQNLLENEHYRLSRQPDPVVDSKENCHTWSGATDSNACGKIRIQFCGRRVHLKAHIVICALVNPVACYQTPSNDMSHLFHNRQCVHGLHM